MPIVKKEVELLKTRLEELRIELLNKYGANMRFAEYRPRPSDLFEYFVLYNAALALQPDKLEIMSMFRGDFRSTGWLPLPGDKSYKTVWRMGITIKPDIIISKNGKELAFWFDKSYIAGFRPDIVIRLGKFEFREVSLGELLVSAQSLKDGNVFAEYANMKLNSKEGYFTEVQDMDYAGGKRYLSFRAKEEYKHPPLIIECKSFGARLGSIDNYAKHASSVVLVSPEKLYEPKSANIHVVRISKELSNNELKEKIKPYLAML